MKYYTQACLPFRARLTARRTSLWIKSTKSTTRCMTSSARLCAAFTVSSVSGVKVSRESSNQWPASTLLLKIFGVISVRPYTNA